MMQNSIQQRMVESIKTSMPTTFTAVVRKVYPKLYKVDVEDLTSGKRLIKVPLLSPYAGSSNGNTYGLMFQPSEGDIVLVTLINNSSYDPVVIGSLYTNTMTKPTINSDEFIIKHKSGAEIKILADGSVTITAASSKVITLGTGTSINSWLDNHVHPTGVGPSGKSLIPSPTAGAAMVTI